MSPANDDGSAQNSSPWNINSKRRRRKLHTTQRLRGNKNHFSTTDEILYRKRDGCGTDYRHNDNTDRP